MNNKQNAPEKTVDWAGNDHLLIEIEDSRRVNVFELEEGLQFIFLLYVLPHLNFRSYQLAILINHNDHLVLRDVNNRIECFGGVFDLLNHETVMDYFFFPRSKRYRTVNLVFDSFVHYFPFDSFLGSNLFKRYLGLNRPQYSMTF